MIGRLLGGQAARIMAARIMAALMLLLLVLGAPQYCQHRRHASAQLKQHSRSDKALAEIAKEAADTVIRHAETGAKIDDLVDQTVKEITNAHDYQESRRAAVRAICQLPDYRDDPGCQLHRLHP